MTNVREKSETIRRYILEHIDMYPSNIARIAADNFHLTRQAINKHLQKLVKESSLTVSGKTRNKMYQLVSILEQTYTYEFTTELAEDLIWRKDIKPVLGNMPENVLGIWHYGFTEMFNNVIDHSNSTRIAVQIKKTAVNTEMVILDDGVGIFKKIQTSLNLLDERHAILELSKGKLTTDPEHHSGEGIFFTSRMFDSYDILSGGVHFSHNFEHPEDWISERNPDADGTTIRMKLPNHTTRTAKKIFDQYTSGDDYGFTKTVVPVKLAQYGNDLLISRSQAKRLVSRIELFKTVVFDFTDVPSIGQAFADEIFRVFANQNPSIELVTVHANVAVTQMINRAKTKV